MNKIITLICLLLLTPLKIMGSHIIGGELTYVSLGNNQYEVTLIMYRDCAPSSTPFSSSYQLYIHNLDDNNSDIQTLSNPELNYIEYDALENDCIELPGNICVQQAIFTGIIEIENPEDNYTLFTQTCCRDEAVINIIDPLNQGSTFNTFIPSNEITTDNNSAIFNSYPPLGICLGDDISIDLSATDIDGDSLTYELTAPYNDINWTPPFSTVPWGSGYSSTYPIDASPPLAIDPNTGIITGTPSQLGMYIIAVKVSEYHNGVLINELIRDFRFLVVDCESTTAFFPETGWYCSSLTVDFTNQSQDADNYLWTFGDPTNPGFSTTIESPSYTYPSNGTYTVTLIADPGEICADTMSIEFPIIDAVYADFTTEEISCSNDLNFIPSGMYPPNATFSWNFGPGSSPGTSNLQSPTNIAYNTPGQHEVSLTVSYNTCDSTTTNYIESVAPVIDPQISSSDSLCFENNEFTFSAAGLYPSSCLFSWDFGINASIPNSTLAIQPGVSFNTSGIQEISLTLDYNDCLYSTYDSVYLYPFQNINFSASDVEDCEPFTVLFTPNILNTDFVYNWDFQGPTNTAPLPIHTFMDGFYDISLEVMDTTSGCVYSHFIEDYIHAKPTANAEFSILSESPQCFDGHSFDFQSLEYFHPLSSAIWDFGNYAQPQTYSSENPENILFSEGGTHQITLNIELDGCDSYHTENIHVHPEENPVILSNYPIDCEPLEVNFQTNLNTANYNFTWDLALDTSNLAEPSFTYYSGDYDISLNLLNTETNCEFNLFEENYVHVEPQPVASFNILNESFFYDDEIWIESHAENSTNYLYDFGTGYTTVEENPIYTYPGIWDYEITQYAMNDIGCIDSITNSIFIDYPFTIYLPNAFTPNDDNHNDTFYADLYRVDYYEMKIFNRWGEMVFDGSGEKPIWDGKSKRGYDCAQGSYVYTINYHSLEHGWGKLNGSITLLR